jgi:hypothetical protein
MNNPIEYFNKLFSDPSFGVLLGIFSIWYSYYLFKRPPRSNELFLITMTNSEKEAERETYILIINYGQCDITRANLLNKHPLKLCFDSNLTLFSIVKHYESFIESPCTISKIRKNEYLIDFDIIKKGQGVMFLAVHDSKLSQFEVYTQVKLEGTIINFDFNLDDFSDQMIPRANGVGSVFVWVGSFLMASLLTFGINTFLSPFNFNLKYLIIGVFVVCLILSINVLIRVFLNAVGVQRYDTFWKYRKRVSELQK